MLNGLQLPPHKTKMSLQPNLNGLIIIRMRFPASLPVLDGVGARKERKLEEPPLH